jgi:hypothetical protein
LKPFHAGVPSTRSGFRAAHALEEVSVFYTERCAPAIASATATARAIVLFEPALCSKQAALARDADPCPGLALADGNAGGVIAEGPRPAS